jgi:hypothetical protein
MPYAPRRLDEMIAAQRTREELTALIEGRLSTASAKDELVKLAKQVISLPWGAPLLGSLKPV